MNHDANPQPPTSGGYVSLVAHIWIGDGGKIIRGTIEDAHTGRRLALDLSELVGLLQGSLAHAPGWMPDPHNEESTHANQRQPYEEPGTNASAGDIQGDDAEDRENGN